MTNYAGLLDWLQGKEKRMEPSDRTRARLDSSTDMKPLIRSQTDVKRRAHDDALAAGGYHQPFATGGVIKSGTLFFV